MSTCAECGQRAGVCICRDDEPPTDAELSAWAEYHPAPEVDEPGDDQGEDDGDPS